jgi:non-canonical poly(A) RNA polymerase PAPD5/7
MDKRMDNGTESYMTWNLGSLLLEFLNLYGNSLNYTDVGISIVNGGSYFSKYDHDWGESANQFQNTITRYVVYAHDVKVSDHVF